MKTLAQIKNVIKKWVKPEYQKLVLSELQRLEVVWDNLPTTTKDSFTGADVVDFFFSNDITGLFEADDLFIDAVNEDEDSIFIDWFIQFVTKK